MHKNALVGFAVLALIALGAMYLASRIPAPSGSVSNTEEASVRASVVEFGSKLKNVSLLAPDAAAQIKAQYGTYASPALIAQWQADPSGAPGRRTSSPWPDRIEVLGVSPSGLTSYSVRGNVIEVASADAPLAPVAVYPVELTVEISGGSLIITSLTKGALSELPQRRSIEGTWECLPHRPTGGPQTLECAFGIQAADGHYAVNTSLMAASPVDYPTGTRVRVEGVVVPVEQLSSDTWRKYDIVGIISATTITRL